MNRSGNLINRFYDYRFKRRIIKYAKSSLEKLDETKIAALTDLAVELIDDHILDMIIKPMDEADNKHDLSYGKYFSVWLDLKEFTDVAKGNFRMVSKEESEIIEKVIPLKSNVIQLLFHNIDSIGERVGLDIDKKGMLFCAYYSEIIIKLKLLPGHSSLYRPHVHNPEHWRVDYE
jgi:hypothetical protein